MATQTIVTCDVHGDGLTPASSVSFGIDGTQYEVDVCDAHAAELRGMLARYVEVARSGRGAAPSAAPRRGPQVVKRQGKPRRADLSDVRGWARAQGYEISSRGRIPAAILQEYDGKDGKSRRRSR